jgi:hypothetical protein
MERAEDEVARLDPMVGDLIDRLTAAEAENAALRATVDRVRALCDEWEDERGYGNNTHYIVPAIAARAFRAALADPKGDA